MCRDQTRLLEALAATTVKCMEQLRDSPEVVNGCGSGIEDGSKDRLIAAECFVIWDVCIAQ